MTIDEADVGDFSGAMESLNLDIREYDHSELERMPFAELARAKQRLEATLETLFDLLKHKYNFDMHQPLVVDGFPRADVDVVSIRLVRTKIIRLRNDHAYVLGLLEARLSEQLLGVGTESAGEVPRPAPAAFAWVKEVVEGSPASKAGLRLGDRICVFDGDIRAHNHSKLMAVAARVKSKQDQEVKVEVSRGGEQVELTLVPTEDWPGRGLLGCLLIPL